MAPSGYYEDGAAFVSEQGTTVTGSEAIREVLSGFMTTKPKMTTEAPWRSSAAIPLWSTPSGQPWAPTLTETELTLRAGG